MEFVRQHITSIIAIAPVNQASETPIDVQVKEKVETYRYNWNNGTPEREPHTY